MKATPIAMTTEAVMITDAPVSNDNERIRFSIVQRRLKVRRGWDHLLQNLLPQKWCFQSTHTAVAFFIVVRYKAGIIIKCDPHPFNL